MALQIRIDAKIEKKAKEMQNELLTLKRIIKDLESSSEVCVGITPRLPLLWALCCLEMCAS